MAKRVQDVAPPRAADVEKWLKHNIAAQKKRHRAIMKEINDDLAPKRARWYKEFLRIVQTKGFNFNGDNRRKIP